MVNLLNISSSVRYIELKQTPSERKKRYPVQYVSNVECVPPLSKSSATVASVTCTVGTVVLLVTVDNIGVTYQYTHGIALTLLQYL